MPTTARLTSRIVPALLVRDMSATIAFYRTLGFRLTGCHPGEENATWAEMSRDAVTLRFHTEAPCGTPGVPALSGTIYLHPDSVEALAEEWRGKVEFAWGPEKMDYGLYEFGIRDPDGYFLAFAEPA